MPRFILKPVEDEDFYIDWSTIVDSPIEWGTRGELQRSMAGRSPVSASPDRFDRADATGTSFYGGEYGFDHAELWVREIGPRPFYVSRRDLRAFCMSLQSGEYDSSLTRPWNPDDEALSASADLKSDNAGHE